MMVPEGVESTLPPVLGGRRTMTESLVPFEIPTFG